MELHVMRLRILASHEGSTLQAVLNAVANGHLSAEISVVISNNGAAGALRKARAAGLLAVHLSSVTHPNPEQLDQAILDTLTNARTDVVLLTGYMKKLSPQVLQAYEGRIVNTHPALLPRFGGKGMYGDRVHQAVLASGDAETGISLHLVDPEYDTGKVLAQCRVPVLPGDSVADLSARVRTREKEFLVEMLGKMAEAYPMMWTT